MHHQCRHPCRLGDQQAKLISLRSKPYKPYITMLTLLPVNINLRIWSSLVNMRHRPSHASKTRHWSYRRGPSRYNSVGNVRVLFSMVAMIEKCSREVRRKFGTRVKNRFQPLCEKGKPKHDFFTKLTKHITLHQLATS
jgi:hypothetical protein